MTLMSPLPPGMQAIACFRINQSLQMPAIGLATVIWSVASELVMLHVTFGFPDQPHSDRFAVD
jgi:hypothetical protein